MTAPARVAVIGGGRMGGGIAHAFLTAGSIVDLRDVSEAAVARGRENVEASLRKAAAKGVLNGSPEEAQARLSTGVGLAGIGMVDLVIEAVPEVLALKQQVWREVWPGVPTDAVLATNTSSISIADIADSVDHPERFLGMHFFNPVPVSRLVEIVRSDVTSADVLSRAAGWTAAIGKQSIVVRDRPGFATSRLGVAVGLEAIRMLEEGVGEAEEIDRGMILGYGFPLGPLRLTDIVGLDVRLEIAEYLESTLGARFRAPNLLRDKVARGELGRKSGQGFYTWTDTQ
jgi:3-hydroxybutyryl-CoA dehydrogenase